MEGKAIALSDADVNSLIIVGAVGCDMTAELVAAGKGVSVLLLDKTNEPGVSTAFPSWGIRAAGSRFQRALDIEDNSEQYGRDIFGRNTNDGDPTLTQRLAGASGPIADFLVDGTRISFSVGELVLVTAPVAPTRGRKTKRLPTSCERRLKVAEKPDPALDLDFVFPTRR